MVVSLLCHCGWCYRWTGGTPLCPHLCADTLIFVLETTWSLVIYSLILQTNSSESLALVTVFFLRCIAISCAFVQIYFPEGVLLRLISRESVDWLIPTMSAISFLAVFFWSKAKICDLCSEINWWYICNTKLVNLGETSGSFFYLYCWLFLFPLREGHSFIALRFGTCNRSWFFKFRYGEKDADMQDWQEINCLNH